MWTRCLAQIVRTFTSHGRLRMTGTNLKELFVLLNFVCPEIFSDSDSFLHKGDSVVGGDEDANNEVAKVLCKLSVAVLALSR